MTSTFFTEGLFFSLACSSRFRTIVVVMTDITSLPMSLEEELLYLQCVDHISKDITTGENDLLSFNICYIYCPCQIIICNPESLI